MCPIVSELRQVLGKGACTKKIVAGRQHRSKKDDLIKPRGVKNLQKASKITLGGAREGSEQKKKSAKNAPQRDIIMQKTPKWDPQIAMLVVF